jgi:hypothetical protein
VSLSRANWTSYSFKERILILEKSHQEKVAALSGRQFGAIGTALVIWIVPALALLALGIAIGWVRRGFQNG